MDFAVLVPDSMRNVQTLYMILDSSPPMLIQMFGFVMQVMSMNMLPPGLMTYLLQ